MNFPLPVTPISLAIVTGSISMYLHTDCLFHRHKGGPMQAVSADTQGQPTPEVFQGAAHSHASAALINRQPKASEGVNGSCKKAILFVCVFLKQQRSIYRTSQTNQGCRSERSAPSSCSTALAICSLLPGATMYLGWHFLMTGASMCSL